MTADSVWVRTDPDPTGAYVCTIEADADTARTLDRRAALDYAAGVMAAAARAEYDAAVKRQFDNRYGDTLDPEAVGQLIADLRDNRPKLSPLDTYPLELTPGVSLFTGEPFLALAINDKRVGQWTPTQARGHAMHVLECLEGAELDNGYLRALTTIIGIEEPRARNVIADLANHRPEARP